MDFQQQIDILWLCTCCFLVFLMQAGFLCLESGLTRTKNNINVATKNLADLGVSTLVLWCVGFGLIFGNSLAGVIGGSSFFPDFAEAPGRSIAFFLLQAMFCGTVVTIVSGAAAERLKFVGYLLCAVIISGLIYPLCAHAVWNAEPSGWLAKRGFVDFAGGSVVHSVGGWVSLAMLLVIGPRAGVFDEDGKVRHLNGSNLTMAMLGVLLLWLGWFGFNGGSFFAFSEAVPKVLFVTLLGGGAGVVTSLVVGLCRRRRILVMPLMTGCIAGLVSVTAGADVLSPRAAIVVAVVGSILANAAASLLHRFRIDDAVEAVPAHLVAGIWGTLAVAFFGKAELLGTGLSFGQQVLAQLVGIGYIALIAFGISFLLFWSIHRVFPLRVSSEQEKVGLNISEHNAATDFHDLFVGMTQHRDLKDLGARVPEEPFTEAGMVATLYNRVLQSLQTSMAHNQTVISTAMDGIFTLSKSELRITSVNPAAAQILGYAPEAMMGQEVSRFFSIGDREAGTNGSGLRSVLGKLGGQGTHLVLWGRNQSDQFVPIEMSLAEAAHASDLHFVGVFRDMSERVAAESRLRGERDRAEAASRAKSEFLANMSHELRTPLNAIIGYSELIGLEPPREDTWGKTQQDLNTINASGQHLLAIINDLLDISKIEAGKMEVHNQSFAIGDLLDQVYRTLRPLSDKQGNELTKRYDLGDLGSMHSDGLKIRQILMNLTSNACKFTKDGQVELAAARISEPGGDWLHFRITDTGIGMSPDVVARVFDAFTQASAGTTKEYGGTGLGLTISQAFCGMLGGRITVQSEVGVGTAMNLYLPADNHGTHETQEASVGGDPATMPVQSPPSGAPPAPSLGAPLITVIDDDTYFLELISRQLEGAGYRCQTVSKAKDAISALEADPPSLILLDILLPEIGGQVIFEQIQAHTKLRHIPVFVVSIVADEFVGCFDTATKVLSKPIASADLLASIRDVVLSD